MEYSGIAKPQHTWARARATFACALAFACCSFKLAPHAEESANSKIFLEGMPPDSPKRVHFRTLTFHTLRSTVFVALHVPDQLPYSGYATDGVYFHRNILKGLLSML